MVYLVYIAAECFTNSRVSLLFIQSIHTLIYWHLLHNSGMLPISSHLALPRTSVFVKTTSCKAFRHLVIFSSLYFQGLILNHSYLGLYSFFYLLTFLTSSRCCGGLWQALQFGNSHPLSQFFSNFFPHLCLCSDF